MSYPEDTPVEVKFPLDKEQEHGDRTAWPWLPGWVTEVCGPDEWQVMVQAPGLGVLEDGTPAGPDVPEDEQFFPLCFRDSSEIREPQAEAEAGS